MSLTKKMDDVTCTVFADFIQERSQFIDTIVPHISIVSYSSLGWHFIYLSNAYVSVSSAEATCIHVARSQNVCFNNVIRGLVFVAHFSPHTGKRM